MEETGHTARSGVSTEPYRQRSLVSVDAGLDEPKEEVGGVVGGKRWDAAGGEGDVAGVLLLGLEDGSTRAVFGGGIRDGDVRIERGAEDGRVGRGRREALGGATRGSPPCEGEREVP